MPIKVLSIQIARLFLALLLGNLVGLATFAFYWTVVSAMKIWELEIEVDFVSIYDVS